MATFDSLVQEIDERYCLGPKARAFIDETRRYISKRPGGVRGFVEKCNDAGFRLEVASWLNGSDPVPLSGEEAEQTLGSEVVQRIAAKVGVSHCFARTILGYAIPKVVALRAQGGAIPAAICASASRLMRAVPRRESASSKEFSARCKDLRQALGTNRADAEPVLGGLIIPCVTMLMILGLLFGYFVGISDRGAGQLAQDTARKESASPQPGAATSGSAPLSTAGGGWALPGSALPPPLRKIAANESAPPNVAGPMFPVVYFAANRATPIAAGRHDMPKVTKLIKQLPKGTVVEIAGYTDGAGRPLSNMRLSQRRANAIRGALIRAGVDPGALIANGHGVFHPPPQASENTTVEGRSTSLAGNRSQNGRRVEFKISDNAPAAAAPPQ